MACRRSGLIAPGDVLWVKPRFVPNTASHIDLSNGMPGVTFFGA